MTSVITTINYPTEAVEKLAERTDLIIVFDKKTPNDWFSKKPVFEIVCGTNHPDYAINQFLPFNHYSRKNIGYLEAIKHGSKLIYDTDDDNVPNENWKQREYDVNCIGSVGDKGWYNIYRVLGDGHIWPRGFPLEKLRRFSNPETYFTTYRKSSIQQGLANGDPDVDAIWRLIINNSNTDFNIKESVYLKPGHWCPFNSQSTWWFPKAYPLMYLPIHATFRMTDIWRSFVAQRCLWEMGEGVTFHSPAEVFQDRNKHDLLKDFESEVPGYLHNDLIVQTLSDLILNGDVCQNLITCYKALVDIKVLPMEEVRSVNNWIKDINKIWKP